jgi:soluble lytic murein transglycosylase-like protein
MAGPSQEILQTITAHADPRVPLPIALTMAERESTFMPTKRGAAGEYGLFQLLPKTVRGADIGYKGPLEALLEPGLNTKLATGYLALLKDRFGTWPVAIRAYNGSGAAAQSYAVGVLQRLPAWDTYVRENLAFFAKALKGKGAIGAAALVAVAAVAALLLFRGSDREAAA